MPQVQASLCPFGWLVISRLLAVEEDEEFSLFFFWGGFMERIVMERIVWRRGFYASDYFHDQLTNWIGMGVEWEFTCFAFVVEVHFFWFCLNC